MPGPAAVAMALEQADVVQLVPAFQRGAEGDPTDAGADAGDLAVGGEVLAVFVFLRHVPSVTCWNRISASWF